MHRADAAGAPARVLVLFAHPAFQSSRINRHLVRAIRGLENVTFHDLYEAYPDLMIDVPHEQQLLSEHDVIVFQHPFYWYSSPAMLKEWQDLVLEHGFAYGTGGTALVGKKLLSVVTAGGSRKAYQEDGLNRFPVPTLLLPFAQTAHLCGMDYLPPFVVHGTHKLDSDTAMHPHADGYARLLRALVEGRVDMERARTLERINDDLNLIIQDDHAH